MSDFRVKLETNQGDVLIEVHTAWAPLGAARFKELVESKFYDDCRFFRVISGFMVQFGISGEPETMSQWRAKAIADDPVLQSNKRGRITYAMAGPNTRTTQVFISFGDNSFLDRQGFAPFGEVTEGMEVIDKLYAGYGEGAPQGNGPAQHKLQMEGNSYLKAQFPKLDFVRRAAIVS